MIFTHVNVLQCTSKYLRIRTFKYFKYTAPLVDCLEFKYKYKYIALVQKVFLSISTSTQEGVLSVLK